MIRKVVVNNFKMFKQVEFEIPPHLVVVGPNNSGKTTLLQAIGAWAEIAYQWVENNPDLAREQDGNYPSTNLNLLRFYSVPLADFHHLWKDKNVQGPTSVGLHTDQWKIEFEVIYRETEMASIRPAQNVHENDLEKFISDPLIPVYIPPLSGVETMEEPSLNLADVLPSRLARAQAGSILRNLLLAVSKSEENWAKLQDVVKSFFGYELDVPSGGAQIYARYRHFKKSQSYDVSSAASGFLQVLMIYAVLLAREASVLLIDEPDAHLHLLLQDKMYRDLYKFSQETQSQLIIATHSERIINAAADKDRNSLRLLAGELKEVPDKSKLIDTLRLETVEIVQAQTSPRMLYTEGSSDVDILREWASVLGHPSLPFLEKPLWKGTASDDKPAAKHFSAMRLLVPNFQGVELRDSDNKEYSNPAKPPTGMICLFWNRYEIESYLLHPKSIRRYIESNASHDLAEKAEQYMKQHFPPALYKNPLGSSAFLLDPKKAKIFLSNVLQESGLNVNESDFYQIAAKMKQDEIHPEVMEKLDAIAAHFNLGADKNEAEDSR